MFPFGRPFSRFFGAQLATMLQGLRQYLPRFAGMRNLQKSQQVVADLRLELGRSVAAHHLASKQLAELELRHVVLQRDIDAALDSGLEDLARAGIAEVLHAEAQIDRCRRTVRRAGAAQRKLEHILLALLRAQREFAESLNPEDASDDPAWGKELSDAPSGSSHPATHERLVQERLLELKSRRTQKE